MASCMLGLLRAGLWKQAAPVVHALGQARTYRVVRGNAGEGRGALPG